MAVHLRGPHYTFAMTFARLSRSAQLTAIALGAVFALSLATSAHAQWKWKDKSGRVQYSDIPPPPSVSESDVLQRPTGATRQLPQIDPKSAQAAAASQAANAASVASAAGVKPAEPELEAKRKKVADDEAAKKKAEEDKAKAARAENCSRAQAQVRALNDGMRMARVNAKGEREVLDDAQRAAEGRRAQEIMKSECK